MNDVLLPEQLLETSNSNELTIKHEIGRLIKALEDEIDKANENKDKLRAAILTAMQNNNIYQAKVDGYTISQVVPKSTTVFDKDRFIEEVDTDVVSVFVTIVETETFDLDKFKAENLELYKKYVTTASEVNVDEKKLAKMLPSLYEKYSTEIKSDKPSTLRIAKSKGA